MLCNCLAMIILYRQFNALIFIVFSFWVAKMPRGWACHSSSTRRLMQYAALTIALPLIFWLIGEKSPRALTEQWIFQLPMCYIDMAYFCVLRRCILPFYHAYEYFSLVRLSMYYWQLKRRIYSVVHLDILLRDVPYNLVPHFNTSMLIF